MLGISSLTMPAAPLICPLPRRSPPYSPQSRTRIGRKRSRPRILRSSAQNGDENDGSIGESKEKRPENERRGFSFRWRELLDPDPENIAAVGLTGLLTWASVQVLWQLFFIAAAILLAALKYSFIAALLVFILITLL